MEVAETKVHLPAGLEPPYEVYVNGVRQREGSDFVRRGDELAFSRPLAHEGRLGFWRWTSLFLGVAGTYRRHDSVDLVYEVEGKRIVRTGLPFVAAEPIESGER